MGTRRRLFASAVRFGAAASITAAIVAAHAPPADAECVYADVWITWSGGGTSYITPWPEKQCLLPTPWTYPAEPYVDDNENHIPTGMPNGGGVQAGVPTPV
jgi:hypothetical protein